MISTPDLPFGHAAGPADSADRIERESDASSPPTSMPPCRRRSVRRSRSTDTTVEETGMGNVADSHLMNIERIACGWESKR